MAKQKYRKKDGKKAGLIAFGVTLVAYSLIFPFHALGHYIIGGALSAGVAWVVKTMATPMPGLDKNAKAKDSLNVTVVEDEYARSVVEDGVAMLDALKAERDAINEYVFTRRINDLRANYDQLLRSVIEDPGKASRLRKFNSYYLPTAVKLLQSYRAAKQKGTSFHTMSATRDDILALLDKLTAATTHLQSAMLQDELDDMDVEMDVLDRMLKSDGLSRDEMVDDMRQAAHAASREMPMSAAPTVKPTAPVQQPAPPPVKAAPIYKPAPQPVQQPRKPVPQPVKAAEKPAAPRPRPAEAPYQPQPVEMDYKVQVKEHPAGAPAPVLEMPATATAAQMREGAPVLEMPDMPQAPHFDEAREDTVH